MSSEKFELKTSDILVRVGSVLKSHRGEAIGEALGAAPSTISNWRSRNTVPWSELFNFSKERGVDFVWLLTGCESNQSWGLVEDRSLIDKYINIIKHYERIIEAQAAVIDQLSKALGGAVEVKGKIKNFQ